MSAIVLEIALSIVLGLLLVVIAACSSYLGLALVYKLARALLGRLRNGDQS